MGWGLSQIQIGIVDGDESGRRLQGVKYEPRKEERWRMIGVTGKGECFGCNMGTRRSTGGFESRGSRLE